MNRNVKRIGVTLLTAIVGGAVAIGAYKILEPNSMSGMSLDQRQKVYFANNPSQITSSTGAIDFTQAAAAVSPGVVHVRTTYSRSMASNGGVSDPFGDMFQDFFGKRQRSAPSQNMPAPMGKGSGVIVTSDGYIMTNNHVVEDAEKIEVILSDKRVLNAKVIGRDKNTDLALIKINATDLPVVKLGNSDNVKVGEWVLAVGYPLTLESTVTAGIVSAKSRQIGILAPEIDRNNYDPNNPPTNSSIESYIQTDAVINKGNSGGALVNANGELIGINSAIASQTGTYEGYGFAIPVNLAKKVMDDFLKYGEVKRGYIGVTFQELNFDNAEQLGTKEIEGLYVNSTVEGGAAAIAGIKKGDIIKKLNDHEITSSASLQEKIGTMRPGDKVTLTVLRDGKMKNFDLTLKGDAGMKLANNGKEVTEVANSLGATFSPLNDAAKKKYGVSNGVLVTSTAPGKVFDMYEIPRGTVITSINGKGVNNNDQVMSALKQNDQMIDLRGVTPDGSTFRVTFPIK
ncbi:Do family serine endopeptidase [Pedobacter sp. SD-b]|uniref:Do family serine endopeptidase n=1 Tax=Pedobacter segetis TaxID=2793069 RepID=A0ABS1BH85_9SPHI|nr:Do family serine endopeptidase [Pedobacter segetis]MBK0382243.1 Do family serine endopeptidase [Pedobacter segetis]